MLDWDEVNQRTVWMFKQPRTGSNWCVTNLAAHLKRQHECPGEGLGEYFPKREPKVLEYFQNRKQQPDDVKKIFSTHHFLAMESLDNYYDPILIRTARKNLTDHLISMFVAVRTQIFNITQKEQLNYFTTFTPREISNNDIVEFINYNKLFDDYWNLWCKKYKHEVIYYEDLVENGYESKILPVKFKLTETMYKLPYDKREIIINYDEVDSICKDYQSSRQ